MKNPTCMYHNCQLLKCCSLKGMLKSQDASGSASVTQDDNQCRFVSALKRELCIMLLIISFDKDQFILYIKTLMESICRPQSTRKTRATLLLNMTRILLRYVKWRKKIICRESSLLPNLNWWTNDHCHLTWYS